MSLLTSFRDAPIKRKLTLISLLTSGLALLYIVLILAASGWVDRRADAVSDWTTFARVIGANATTAMLFDDADAATKTLAALAASPDIADAVIYDKAGEMFARYPAPQHDPGAFNSPVKPGSHLFSTTRLMLSEPIEFKGGKLGSIYLEVDLRDMYADILRDAGLVFLVALSAFLASLFLFAKLQKTIVDPITELSDGMEKVSAGQDYALRVEVHGKDEVGTLARGFNNMLEHIQQRDTELARHREHLEEEVAQRTVSLRESENRFRKLFENANDAIFIHTSTGEILDANPQAENMLGYPLAVLKTMPIPALHPPEELETSKKAFEETISKGSARFESRFRHSGGGLIDVEISARIVDSENGIIQGVARDITKRRLAEMLLLGSEKKFKAIFDNATDGISIADIEDKKLLLGNATLCRMLGYAPEEISKLHVMDIHPKNDLPYVISEFERAAKEGNAVLENIPVMRKDGSVFYAEIATAFFNYDGRTVLAGFFKDITERKRAEEKIHKLNEELEAKVQQRTRQLLEAQEELVRKEKLSVLGQVAGSVGHELRNPLGVMSNAVYFLQTVLPDADETVKEYLEIIKNEIAGSERIVSDLLDSVRTKPPHPEMVGVAELVGQTLRKVTVPAPVTVKLDIPATLPPLRVDGMQIGQVLRNFISNGVEAMPEGGVLEIRAVENKTEKTIAVSVRDSGIGMTPEQLGKLFQPLFTTKARGIGLGLVVVKNLTEANGGTVEVQSEVGKGTLFTITLPAAEETGVSI